MPVITSIVGGVLLWAAAAVAERAAVTLPESLPGLVLAIGVVGGSRLDGDFVNISTAGFAGVAFGLPVLAGLLLARWLGVRSTSSYLLGAAATAAGHAVLATGLGLFTFHDPTSFSVVEVSWVPTSSLFVAGLAWGTAWLVTGRRLHRTAWLGLAAVTATGAASAILVAVREGVRGELLPVAALVGGAYGPNLAGFSLVWLPRTEAGMLGGRHVDAEHLLAFTAQSGRWTLLVPAIAVGLLALAASRARGLDAPADAWRRLRDLALGVSAMVPLTAAAASPRTFEPDGTARWFGVPDGPGALIESALALLLLLVVPQVVAAIVSGETWPRDLAAGVRERLRELGGAGRRAEPPAWPTSTEQPWGPVGPAIGGTVAGQPVAHGGPSVAGHGVLPHGVTPQPPVHNPFDDGAAPPVSAVWSQIAPAASDPGARAASQRPAPARGDEDAWRNAPPPTTQSVADEPVDPNSGGAR